MFKFQIPRLPLKGMPYITLIVLLGTIASTLIIPILPLYLKKLLPNDALVGYVFTYIAFLFLLYTFILRKLLTKVKKITLLKIGYLGTAITLLIFTILTNITQFLILELFRAFFLVSTAITMGLFIREYTKIKSIGKTEGQYFTVLNIGFLLGPLMGGLLASAYSFNTVFIIAAILKFFIALLIVVEPLKETTIKKIQEIKFTEYIKNKQLIFIYIMQFGLTAWFFILYNFLPLYANDNGFSPKFIGYILFAAVIPLILLEFPIGKLADKNGFRKYISFGFIIIGLFTLTTYFANPLITIIIITIATTGAAFIEPLTEAYFFEEVRIKGQEESLYPIYKTSQEVSSIIFPLIFSTILLFYNFKILFLVVAVFMLIFSFLALKLRR